MNNMKKLLLLLCLFIFIPTGTDVQAATLSTKFTHVEAGGETFKVRWKPVKKAKYYVYRKEKGKSWTKVATIKDYRTCLYYDTKATPGKYYSYGVKVVKGIFSGKKVTTSYKKKTMPEAVITEYKKNTDGSYKLVWNKAPYAKKYKVYMKTADSEDWTVYKTTTSTTCKVKKADIKNTFTVQSVGTYASSAYGEVAISLPKSTYKSKKVLVIGDSIIRGSSHVLSSKYQGSTIAKRIKLDLGCKVTNKPYSSLTIGKNKEFPSRVLPKMISKKKIKVTGYDVIMISLGGRDYNYGLSIGKTSNTTNKTFTGGLIQTVKLIHKYNSSAKIVLCSPTVRVKNGSANYSIFTGYGLLNKNKIAFGKYSDAMKNVATKYSYVYWYNSEKNDGITMSNILSATTEGAHFTQLSYSKIGHAWAEYLKNMWTPAESIETAGSANDFTESTEVETDTNTDTDTSTNIDVNDEMNQIDQLEDSVTDLTNDVNQITEDATSNLPQ